MFDLPKYLPDILRESGSLFGVFALVAILIALIVFFLFKDSEKQQKERIFLYLALFLLALVFSALFAGVSTGFKSGKEVAITQTKENESLVELPPATLQAIESYLTEQGQAVTPENRAKVLSSALSSYLDGGEASAPSAALPADTSSADSGDQGNANPVAGSSSTANSAPSGFAFKSEGCVQGDKTIRCDSLITNTQDDTDVTLFANTNFSKSRIVDGQGNQYVANGIVIGSESNPSFQTVTLTQNVPVKVTLVVTKVSEKVENVALLEIPGSVKGTALDSPFQARNVPVSN